MFTPSNEPGVNWWLVISTRGDEDTWLPVGFDNGGVRLKPVDDNPVSFTILIILSLYRQEFNKPWQVVRLIPNQPFVLVFLHNNSECNPSFLENKLHSYQTVWPNNTLSDSFWIPSSSCRHHNWTDWLINFRYPDSKNSQPKKPYIFIFEVV